MNVARSSVVTGAVPLIPISSIRSTRDLDLIEELMQAEAREFFWAYRQYMHPDMKHGWWQRRCAFKFQRFHDRFVNHERPKMFFAAPPQHGKTEQVLDFVAWMMGKLPWLKTIYASFMADLGEEANKYLQRQMSGEKYRALFPLTRIPDDGDNRWQRNLSLIEIVDQRGSFRNTTVKGSINGKGLELGILDDPLRGRADAMSKLVRDGVWNWVTDDFFARFADEAGMIMMMTRWHLEDPAGRFLEKFPETEAFVCSAIAEEDEPHRKKGEALFPQHKSLPFLLERKRALSNASWMSEYQGSPIQVGGGMFPVDRFKIIQRLNRDLIEASVRYWDKAGTDEKDGAVAATAGVLMHRMHRDVVPRYVVEDCRVCQRSAMARERIIRQTADMDAATYGYGTIEQWVEQEPGSGGKESAENTARDTLSGHSVHLDRATGDKIIRAEPYAAQVENGNIGLVVGDWTVDFIAEHEVAPNGKTKDRWDASAGAFNKLVASPYDSTLDWVGGPT